MLSRQQKGAFPVQAAIIIIIIIMTEKKNLHRIS